MSKPFLQLSDLPKVIELLSFLSFAQVAAMYGYDSIAVRNGGCGVRNFLKRNGIDPKRFTKRQGRKNLKFSITIQENIAFIDTKPKILKRYIENGIEIKVYESRHAGF